MGGRADRGGAKGGGGGGGGGGGVKGGGGGSGGESDTRQSGYLLKRGGALEDLDDTGSASWRGGAGETDRAAAPGRGSHGKAGGGRRGARGGGKGEDGEEAGGAMSTLEPFCETGSLAAPSPETRSAWSGDEGGERAQGGDRLGAAPVGLRGAGLAGALGQGLGGAAGGAAAGGMQGGQAEAPPPSGAMSDGGYAGDAGNVFSASNSEGESGDDTASGISGETAVTASTAATAATAATTASYATTATAATFLSVYSHASSTGTNAGGGGAHHMPPPVPQYPSDGADLSLSEARPSTPPSFLPRCRVLAAVAVPPRG